MFEHLNELVTLGSAGTLLFSLVAALFRTRAFVDWLNRHVLNGTPRIVPKEELDLINEYLQRDEIRVSKVLDALPELVFLPYTDCPAIADNIDVPLAEQYHDEQFSSGRVDDPHAFLYQQNDCELLQAGKGQSLQAYAIGRYSQLRSLPPEQKHRLLVLGANNLVIRPAKNEFVLHHRGNVAETQSNKLHGFGGGYMPYWENGRKSIAVRRDDCKSLRFTAMRELHEESGLLSLDHVPGFICAIEERHRRDPDGKFGYMTFFFVTLIEDDFEPTYKGDSKEGAKRVVEITKKNLHSMIIHGRIENFDVHPQLRAELLVWIFAGCPGLHFLRRWWLSNPVSRRRLKKSLA